MKPIVPEKAAISDQGAAQRFYATPLDYLLGRLGTKRVILTGQVTEQYICTPPSTLMSAFPRVVVPPDAVAHIDAEIGDAALQMMRRNMSAEIIPSAPCLS